MSAVEVVARELYRQYGEACGFDPDSQSWDTEAPQIIGEFMEDAEPIIAALVATGFLVAGTELGARDLLGNSYRWDGIEELSVDWTPVVRNVTPWREVQP